MLSAAVFLNKMKEKSLTINVRLFSDPYGN